MNPKIIFMALASAGLMFTACNDDDNFDIGKEKEIEVKFNQKYPAAQRVSWEKDRSYFVADFWREDLKAEAEAWFDGSAVWHLTETDIRYDALPQAVKDAFKAGDYSDWRIDDVDMVERPDMETVYVIEVEQGKNEYDLFFSTNGTLIKAVPDTDGDYPGDYITSNLPTSASSYIATNYPQARIVDIDIEKGGMFEVDIIDGTTPRELLFTASGEWVYTKTELRKNEIPQSVQNALAASEYAGYRIDDIDFYNTPDGDYHLLELESGSKEVYVKVLPDGSIVLAKQAV